MCTLKCCLIKKKTGKNRGKDRREWKIESERQGDKSEEKK